MNAAMFKAIWNIAQVLDSRHDSPRKPAVGCAGESS